jgi:ankyrin repeat protein
MNMRILPILLAFIAFSYSELIDITPIATAQVAPSKTEIDRYKGLHKAAYDGDSKKIETLVNQGVNLEFRDAAGRTAIHIAGYASQEAALEILAKAGADLDALEHQYYDVVTIASVDNDYDLLDRALNLGANPGNITSPYEGTALIAAAHLGHYKIVTRLIEAGAPLDHVNNLGWTALIEAIILGNGGDNHIATVKALLKGGANPDISDDDGFTPLQLARKYNFDAIIEVLRAYE